MKIDRLLGILTVLLQNERVTAPYLAERFEVTRRTIGRDIDALCQAGIPIVSYQGAGGGLSIAEGFKLDKSVLTSDELGTMIAAVKGIGSVSEAVSTQNTLDKLAVNSGAVISLKEPIIINLAAHHKGTLTPKLETLKQAIRESRLVQFDYYYEKGVSSRRMEPYFVIFQWTSWYVLGYCLLRKDFRLFKLDRLWNITLLPEGFIPRPIPPEKLDLNAHLTDHLPLVALFDASTRHQLIELYGLNCYTKHPDGRLRFEVGYTNRDYMISWLLSFGSRVQVVQPEDMAMEIREIAMAVARQYETGL